MILFPNAKINLGLDIISRRSDGYHNVVTAMYPIGWSDVLEIVPSPDGQSSLTVTGRSVACPPEKNLVMKALRALETEVGRSLPVNIFLRKIIPDGAGLGGGSSDASSTLIGVNSVMGLGLDNQRLAAVASKIGADCPFFIYNRPMIATGTGTTLSPIDISLKGLSIVVVKPTESVPTREAYSGVNPCQPDVDMIETLNKHISCWQGILKNDFEPSIFAKLPGVGLIKETLLDHGSIYASMSGSGSAVYGIFDRDILADDFSRLFPTCDIWAGKLD